MAHTQLLFVIYDGIHNSVFQSQVLQPILQRLEKTKDLEITLISFEKTKFTQNEIAKNIPTHRRLRVTILKRIPFVIRPYLFYCVSQLKQVLRKQNNCAEIIARGPIAGWIVIKVLKTLKNKISLTVQARGLCAQEYRFTYKHCTPTLIKRLSYHFFKNTYENIERDVYNKCNIESVSHALGEYLIKHFGADPKKITIATKDIPAKIDTKQIQKWKKEVRKELGISKDTYVYVYAGSARPWQCVEETLDWFKEAVRRNPSRQFLGKNPSGRTGTIFHPECSQSECIEGRLPSSNPFLLILTQDKEIFTKLIKEKNIPATSYLIKSVRPNDLYKYLAAANAGLMFRKKDIVNWVARPTKMLEYQSVGLEVVHNGNVGCL